MKLINLLEREWIEADEMNDAVAALEVPSPQEATLRGESRDRRAALSARRRAEALLTKASPPAQ